MCHDALGAGSPGESCPGCGTRLHPACRLLLGRCPTLGCAGRAAVESPSWIAPRSRPRARRWELYAALAVVAALGGGILAEHLAAVRSEPGAFPGQDDEGSRERRAP
jgi:hypothetical protein